MYTTDYQKYMSFAEKRFHVDKKKKVLFISILITIILSLFAFIVFNRFPRIRFDDLITEMLELYPYADNRCAADDSHMIMEWNPNGGGTMRQQILEDTIGGIKFINRKLGFTNSLFGRMADSTAAMGKQSDENDSFIVTWSFNSSTGLEVVYSKK